MPDEGDGLVDDHAELERLDERGEEGGAGVVLETRDWLASSGGGRRRRRGCGHGRT